MGKASSGILFIIGLTVMLGATVEAQNWGLSAVTLDDQHYDAHRYTESQIIKRWKTSGAPGLFQNGQFTYLDNSNVRFTASGVYYVTANIIGLLGKLKYDSYYYREEFYGSVHVTDAQGYEPVDQAIESHVPLESNDVFPKQINLKLSDYFPAQSGWQLSINVYYQGRPLTIKAGSTLSLKYISQPFAFPGVLLQFNRVRRYVYSPSTTLELKAPSYSTNIEKWSKREYSNLVSSMSGGNFVAPVSGLYHVIANIQAEREDDVEYEFAILVDNSFKAVCKNVRLITEGKTTITLEGVLNLLENQTISVSITSNKTEARIDLMWSSFLSISLKGKLSEFVQGLSALLKTSTSKLPRDTWNTLTDWNYANQSPKQFGNIQLSSGAFRITKSGYYYVSISIQLSNCSQASAKLNIKRDATQSVGPGFSFMPKQCQLDLSLILRLNMEDTLQLTVQADQAFTVQPSTVFQVLLQTELDVWPAARLSLDSVFPFGTNGKTPTKVTPWKFSLSQITHNMYFTLDRDMIKIKLSGLYIVSSSIIVKGSSTFQGQFESMVSVNGKQSGSGSKCLRNKTPECFTCTISTLFNLLEDDFLSVQVKASDTSNKKETIHILATSSVSVILVGDTISHPSFKLIGDGSSTSYVTKATTTTQKSLTGFTLSDSTTAFFQTAPVYSKLQNSGFQTGPNNAYFLVSSMPFKLLNDGEVTSSIGSTQSKERVYGWDHTKGLTSVSASQLSYDTSFNFNLSGKAFSSDFNWQPQPGVVSGVFIGNNQSLTVIKARINLKQKSSTQCSGVWIQLGSWTKTMSVRNLGIFKQDSFNVSRGGSYYVVLNLVMKASVAKKVVEVGLFVDNNNTVLYASESTQSSSNFYSILLQGFIILKPQQILEVKIKCPSPLKVTYSKDTSMSGFRVNEAALIPGLHWRIQPEHKHYESRNFIPENYDITQRDSMFYTTGFYYNHSNSEMTRVPKTGVYFISFAGYFINDYGLPITLRFSDNSSSSASCTDSVIPLYYKDTTYSTTPVTASGFVFLKKGQVLNLPDTSDEFYHLYDHLVIYLSLHYMGDVQTTSGFTSTLGQETPIPKGSNIELKDNSWNSGSTCGHFRTAGVPIAFGKYKALYKGFHVATFNLMLDYKENCSVLVCFVIDNRATKFPKESCFERSMTGISNKTTSTIGGSRLMYFEEGDKVSIKLQKNTCQLTISKQSSLSVLYLGTNGALVGFSSVIATSKATLKPRRQQPPYYDYYRYSSHDSDSTSYDVQGWTTQVKNSKTFFQRGLISPGLTDMFVCPRSGVYLILVRLHVKSLKPSDGCVIGAKLAVDSQDIDLGAQIAFSGSENTLSFSSTIMLQRWQAVTVRFTHTTKKCGDMEISQGSLFAAIYLASGKTRSSEWPNNGPHIVQIPPTSVTIRQDKLQASELVCKAVGKYSPTYQWINDNKEIISKSGVLDTSNTNLTGTEVTCVVKMGKFITQSSSISVKIIDPTVVFIEDYENMTYDKAENFTSDRYSSDYTQVMTFGAREKLRGYWDRYRYWWYDWPIACDISDGNYNNTFFITQNYDYGYGYGYDDQFFDLRAWKNHIDREIIDEYNLTIVCRNTKYHDAANATALIHVVILDDNDNLPVFEKPIYNTTIPKNLRPGEDVIQVMANDDDIAQNGEITYKLLYTSDSHIFEIDKKSGVISLSTYGRLAKPFYVLQVEATDQGNPPRSGYVLVVVDVRGFIFNRTNDNPIFDQSKYTAYMISVAPAGSLVTIVRAYDPDTLNSKHIIYSIYNGDDTTFSIHPKKGIIKTKKTLTVRTYKLEIAAEYADRLRDRHDNTRPRNITLVIIRVKDVDGTKPNFEKSHYRAQIREDAAINTLVETVHAVLGQNTTNSSRLIYSIPTPIKTFVIDPTSGKIHLATNVDYETTKRYAFVVSVKTEDSQSSCTDVTIDITDVNDHSPVITYVTRTITLTKYPGIGEIIGQVNATDRDEGLNGKLRYYLEEDYRVFGIYPQNGTIYTTGHLDCCDVLYGLTVEVKDEGEPPRNTTVQIDVIPAYGGGGGHHGHHGGHHGGQQGSSHTVVIVVSIIGGSIVVILVVGAIYYLRRRRRRNYETVSRNYMTLGSDDDEDDELLDDGAGKEEGGRRLSLISGTSDHSTGSQDNLLPSPSAVNC